MDITNINLGTCPLQYLSIGYVGETGARPVAFDFAAWAEEYGSGVLQLLLQRPGDANPYPVLLDIDGTTATWTPDATATEMTGQGQAQLVYTVGGVVVKNAVFRVLIAPSLGAAGDPPEPYEDWLERLLTIAAEAQQSALDAAESAEAAGTSAGAAAGSAGAAAQSALDAEAAKSGAEAAEQTAQQAAALARAKAAEAAEAGQIAGENADYAQQQRIMAEADAVDAHDSAESAAQSAEDAQAASGAAQTAASAAGTSAAAAAATVTEVETKGAEQIAAINQAGTTQIAAVDVAGAAQVQAIEDRGEKVIASIPSDYTELADDVSDLKSSLNQEVYLLQEDIGEVNYYKATDVALIDVTGSGAYRAGCDCGELPPGNYLLYFNKKTGTTGGLVVTTVVDGEYTQSPSITESPYALTLSVASRVIVRGTVTSVSDWNYYNVKLIDSGSVGLGEKVDGLVKNVCQVVTGWTSGGYVTSGGIGATVTMTIYPSSKSSWKNVVVDCSAGDVFTISGLGGGAYRLWCFVDANNKILDVSGTRAKLDSVNIVAPTNSAKLILHQDITHSTLSECYKGVSPYKERLFELAQNKRMALSPVWENGEVTSNGLATNSQNIRTFYGIGFNQGEKLVITNTDDNLRIAVYKNRANTFSFVGAGFVEKNAQIIVDDWNYIYYVRARRVVLANMNPSEGKDITIEIVNDAVPEPKYSVANSNRLWTVGFTRTFSYANPFLAFERKTLANDGTISDSTVNVLAKLPNVGCVEVRQEINTGCFKVAKVSGNTVTWLTSDEWSYYVCRYLGDASSTYYVLIANSANQSTSITATNASHYIGVYTFTDAGVNVDKLYKLNGKKVAFIGDSITQGRFAKFGASSPNYTVMKPFGALVAEAIGDYNYGQFGIGGACVYNTDWRSLYLNCTKVSGYDVVFVCGGTNDYGNDVSESDFTAAYTYVIETLIANNMEVVVCTPVYRTSRTNANAQGLTLTDYANIEKAIANSHNLLVIDQYTLTNNYTFRSYLPDGLHPDEMGHRIMANNILNEYDRLTV